MLKKLNILIVEDQPMARLAVQSILTNMGCEVMIAKNGALGLKLAGENHFDLIFMDIGLPDMNGFDVTKNIRALQAPYGEVPIVALTAHDDKEHEQRAYEVGMQEFLTKPLTIDFAKDILERFCGKS